MKRIPELVLDIETNGLFDWQKDKEPTKIWCAVGFDVEKEEFHEFDPKNIKALVYLLKKCDKIIGHNFLTYDAKVISRVLDYEIPISQLEDTLVYSKLLEPKRKGGHGLADWGEHFGIPKPEHEDWSKYSEEMLHRCREDVKINVKVWKHLKKEFERLEFSRQSYEVERLCEVLAYRQEKYGMWLDEKKAHELYNEVRKRAAELEQQVSKIFPTLLKPKVVKGEVQGYVPKYTKQDALSGTSVKFLLNRGIPRDAHECTPVYPQEFNLGSPIQRVEHLLRLGWTPLEYTPSGQPKITEESLEVESLPDEVKLFKKFQIATNREKIVKNWLDKTDSKGFVHSAFNPIGAWTHRGSHTNFFGNPPAVQLEEWETEKGATEQDIVDFQKPLDRSKDELVKEFCEKGKTYAAVMGEEGGWGAECRDVWRVPHNDPDLIQIGADASGIQMRAFAHYIQDEEYAQIILNSDIHVHNQELAGLTSRKKAKTFIYAFLLGSGNHKTGVIYDPNEDELENLKHEVMSGQHRKTRKQLDYGLEYQNIPKNAHNYALAYRGMLTKNQFIDSLPGLKRYRQEAKPGWWTAIDGRKILIKSKHLHLAGALQSFESCIMKRAKIMSSKELTKKNVWFRYVNDIHDEFQMIGKKDEGNIIGQTVVKNIRKAGEIYGSLCPLDGEYKLGRSWKDCH